MATTPVQRPKGPFSESIEQQFHRLEAQWREATEYLSDVRKITSHPAFRSIIELGMDVVPLMLHDMESGPSLWVWALPEITGVNPISVDEAGDIRKMTDSWLKWSRENGLR